MNASAPHKFQPSIFACFIVLSMIFLLPACSRATSSQANAPTISPSVTSSAPTPTVAAVLSADADPRWIDALRLRQYQSQGQVTEQLPSKSEFNAYRFQYASDGLQLFALLLVPNTAAEKKQHPVVILNHGYIDPGAYSLTTSYLSIAEFFVRQGFLVLKPDYRGHDQSQAGGGEPFDRLDYAVDVLNLIAALPSIPQADPQNIFLYGHSMGGDVTLKVLEVSSRIRAASLWAPVSISYPESLLYFIRTHRPDQLAEVQNLIMQTYSQNDFPNLSPITNTRYISTPLIIHHGTADESVPYEWTTSMSQVLDQTHVTYIVHTYPNEDHNFTRGSWGTAAQRDLEFFQQHLTTP